MCQPTLYCAFVRNISGYSCLRLFCVLIFTERLAAAADAVAGIKRFVEVGSQGTIAGNSRGTRGAAEVTPVAAEYRQELKNFQDVQYTGDLQVSGTRLDAIFDTGSLEILVMSSKCRSCGRAGVYDGTGSSTYRRGSHASYTEFGSGATLASEAWDKVSVGPLVVQNQSFLEVLKADMPALRSGTFQAIVGIGPPNGNKVLERKGFAENLGVKDFSVCLSRSPGAPGYLIWNDDSLVRSSKMFHQIPVVGTMHWGVELKEVRLRGGESISGRPPNSSSLDDSSSEGGGILGCRPKCGAVIDSGTSLIAAPSEAIAKVAKMVERFGGDCSRTKEMPDLVLNLGGREVRLPATAYVGEIDQDIAVAVPPVVPWADVLPPIVVGRVKECQPLMMPLNKMTQFGPMWILGMPFFRFFYTAFSTSGQGSGHSQQIRIASAGSDCRPRPIGVVASALLRTDDVMSATRPLNVRASTLLLPRWAAVSEDYIHL